MAVSGVPTSVLSVLVQARGITRTNKQLLGMQGSMTRTAAAARGATTQTAALGETSSAAAAGVAREAKAAQAAAGANAEMASTAKAATGSAGRQAAASRAAAGAMGKQAAAGRAAASSTGAAGMAAGGAASRFATAGGVAGAVLAYGLFKSVKAASAFESSFAEVRKTVDTSEAGFQRLEKGLRGLARTIPINVNDLNDLAGEAGALGIKAKDIVKFTRTAAELGISTNLSAGDAATSLAGLSKIMGTAGKDFRRLGSTFVDLGNKGASTESEISGMALRIAGTGKTVGLTTWEVLGLSAALANVRIPEEMGGTAISQVMLQMQDAVAKGGDELESFAAISGMSADEFKRQFAQSVPMTVAKFADGLGKVKKDGGSVLDTLKDVHLGGRRVGDTLLRVAGNTDQFRGALKVANKEWGTNTALTNEANRRYETNASKVEVLKNRANDFAITIGKKLDPIVKELLNGLLKLTSGNVGEWLDRMAKKSQTASDAVDAVRGAWKVLGPVIGVVINFARSRIDALIQIIRSIAKIFKGVVTLFSGLVQGDWKKAWNGAKMIASGAVGVVKGVVKGMFSPLKAAFVGVRNMMRNVFGGAWDTVEGIFESGANAVLGVVRSIIRVLNKIPGVKIGLPKDLTFATDRKLARDPNGKSLGRQSGGIVPGTGDGDKWRKALPAGSFVLNKRATEAYGLGRQGGGMVSTILEPGERYFMPGEVKKIGLSKLTAMNETVSRFQQGGPVGLIGGGVADAVGGAAKSVGSKALGLAGDVAGKGAGFFIGKLPKPNIPEPFAGIGPWLIDHVTEWIKGKVPKPSAGGNVALGGMSGGLQAAMALAQSHGLTITSTTGGQHAPNSWHYKGRAFDAANGSNTPEERAYFLDAAKRWGGRMLELFYDPVGWYIKNGQKVAGAIGGHSDHVHTAMTKGGLVQLLASGGSVVKKVGSYLLNNGFDFRATAGILGNAYRESRWNTASVGSGGGGLWGFTASPNSLADLKSYAKSKGESWTDAIVQTMFMLKHGGMSMRGALNAQNTIPQTTELFMRQWERPGVPALSDRISGAHQASNILREAGIVKAGDGSEGMSERDRKRLENRREMAHRRKAREKQIQNLLSRAGNAKSPVLKKGLLWKVLDSYAKWGVFNKDQIAAGMIGGGTANEIGVLLGKAKEIAAIRNPNQGAGQLYMLSKWLGKNVEINGDEKENSHLSKRLQKVHEKGGKQANKKRERAFKKITRFADHFAYSKQLGKVDHNIEWLGELIDIAGQWATAPGSPGGVEYTNAEQAYEVKLNTWLFDEQQKKQGLLNTAIPYAEHLANMYRRSIDVAKKNPAIKWKVPGYKRGLAAITDMLGSDDDGGTGLRGALRNLIGISGGGGELLQTQIRLQELGVIDTVEKQKAAQDAQGISITDVLDIVQAAKYGVYDNLPRFHTGGVVPGRPGTEVPIMAEAGETVVERGAGTGDVTVEVKFENGMEWLKDFVDVRVTENDRRRDQRAKAGVGR